MTTARRIHRLHAWAGAGLYRATFDAALPAMPRFFSMGEYEFEAVPSWQSPDRSTRPVELPEL